MQSSAARPPSAATAPLDSAVAPATAPPVDAAADELAAVALSLPLAVDDPVLSAVTATVADELTTCVLPAESVLVLTTSEVETAVTVWYGAVFPPNSKPSLATLTLTPPTSASGPPSVSW